MFDQYRPFFALTLALVLSACASEMSDDGFDASAIMEEPAMEAAPMVESILPMPPPPFPKARARAGVLTAGDIDDGLNMSAFQRYLQKNARALGLPRADLQRPVAVQFTSINGQPAPGMRVAMRRPGAADPFWSGYTGVDGRLVVYPALFGA
ncbi:MAG: hypothetical protein HKN18_11015, partial [Silicimonas sp.]|nr:hypothetical protein [Silicimonas sp.]